MNEKAAVWAAIVLLGVVALGHVLRLILRMELTVGDFSVPLWPSVIAVAAFGGTALVLVLRTRRDS
ncbi:MAG: hypothetical protein ACE5FJ_12355 [Gemmatimonadales bacterium]